jgi:hypothetical protein
MLCPLVLTTCQHCSMYFTLLFYCLFKEANNIKAQYNIWMLLQGCLTLNYCCEFFTVTA